MKEVTTIQELVKFAAESYKDKAAYRYKVKKDIVEKSYLDVKNDSDAFSRTLSSYGMKGKHVAVIGPTTYEYIITYLGTVSCLGVIVPLDRELPLERILELLDRADISVLVFDEMYLDIAHAAKETCSNIQYFINMQQEEDTDNYLSFHQCLRKHEGNFSEEINPDSMSSILFTSGTTGKSKGVMLTHKNLIHNVVSVDMKIDGDKAILLTVLPIHHAFCFTCDILLGIYLGVTVCINDSIRHLVSNIQLFKPTIILVVPMIVESMYQKLSEAARVVPNPLKPMIAKKAFGGSVKTIFCGGAYLDPELIDGLSKFGIKLIQGYGMTETAPRISCNFEYLSKNQSVGKILPGMEVKIVDGEIWVKGESVMLGYYKDEDETQKAMENGWLKTGDLGYVDEDDFLYVTGRKKNLIILSNGENVSAEELENKLHAHQINKEVLVYGEKNLIIAEIFPDLEYVKKKRIKDINTEIQKIVDNINKGLPVSKRIHSIKVRENEFEKTTSKKIKRNYSNSL